jgi:hypothetical protein
MNNLNSNSNSNSNMNITSLWASAHKPSNEERAELSLHVVTLEQVAPALLDKIDSAPVAEHEQLAVALLITARSLRADIYAPAGTAGFLFTLKDMRDRLGYDVRIFYANKSINHEFFGFREI